MPFPFMTQSRWKDTRSRVLQSICQWSGAYHKEDTENVMPHCQKCDYNGGAGKFFFDTTKYA